MSSEDNPDSVTIGQTQLKTIEELNALAVNDGFDNWEQMRIFFERHGEYFVGKMIFWNNCVWL